MKAIKKLFLGLLALLAVVVVVACKDDEPKGPTAADAAKTLQITQNKKEIIADFEVTAVLLYENVEFNVTWAVDQTSVAKVSANATNKKYKIEITRPASDKEDVKVNLTATVSKDGDSATKKFEFTVLKEAEPTFENFFNAESGDPVAFEGVIVGKQEYSESYGNTSLNIRALDGKGAIYAYRVKCTKEQYDSYVRGAVVKINGEKDSYNGSLQVGQNTGVIELTGETQTVEPINITEEVKAGKWVAPEYETMQEYIDLHVGDLVRVEDITVMEVQGPTGDSSDMTITLGYAEGQTVKMQIKYSSFNDQHEIYKLWSSLKEGEKISANFVVNYRSGDKDAPGARLYLTELASDLERPETVESVVAAAVSELEAAMAKLLPTYISKAEPLPAEGLELPTVSDERVVVNWIVNGKASQKVLQVKDGNILTMADEVTWPADLTEMEVRAEVIVDDEELGTNLEKPNDYAPARGEYVYFTAWAKEEFNTWEKYYVAKDDEEVTISGTVYAVGFSQNSDDELGRGMALVQSAEGGYYIMAYDVDKAAWEEKFAMNHTVTVKGAKDTYNGKLEVIVEAKDLATAVTTGAEATAVTPTDITNLIKNRENDKLELMQGMYVQVTGAVYQGGKLVVDRQKMAIYSDNNFYKYDTLVNNGIYTICGYMNCYNGLQISPIKATDIDKTGDLVVDYDAEMYGTASSNTNMNSETENYAELVNLDAKKFSVTNVKNSASTATASNPDGTIRMYGSSDGNGNTLTVKTLDGKKIAKLVITFKSNNKNVAQVKVSGLDAAKSATSAEDVTFTVEYSTAVESFTIQSVGTEGAQARISSVQIYYAE